MSRYVNRTHLDGIHRVQFAETSERRLHPTIVLDFAVAIGTGIFAALLCYALWRLT